jgi:hypothetical protein
MDLGLVEEYAWTNKQFYLPHQESIQALEGLDGQLY